MKNHNIQIQKGIVLAVLFTCFFNSSFAQVFWEEDFANGFPTDWTTGETTGNHPDAIWIYCSDPTCPNVAMTQNPFQAETAENGFVSLNSDTINTTTFDPHISILTTPAIDCSNLLSEVHVMFQTMIGVFDFDAETNALFQVSTDSIAWTDYTVFPGLDTGERWSENPEVVTIDVTDVAAGEPQVWLRWYWHAGWEYFWSIDDVRVIAVETPVSNTEVLDNDNLVEVSPNPATEYININIDLVDIQDEVIVEIFDLTGKMVTQSSYSDFQQGQLKVELNQLAVGNYYLNVTTRAGVKYAAFSVQR